mgnify:CR=1 FL=1
MSGIKVITLSVVVDQVKPRTDEHENTVNEAEPAMHIRVNNGNHTFFWRVLLSSERIIKREILEAILVAVHKADKQTNDKPSNFSVPYGNN